MSKIIEITEINVLSYSKRTFVLNNLNFRHFLHWWCCFCKCHYRGKMLAVLPEPMPTWRGNVCSLSLHNNEDFTFNKEEVASNTKQNQKDSKFLRSRRFQQLKSEPASHLSKNKILYWCICFQSHKSYCFDIVIL